MTDDRIDSLDGKSQLNYVFAMFRSIGYKSSRKRTWKKTKSLADESILKSKTIEFYRLLNQGFLVSQVGPIFDYLFHIPKNSIINLRDLYFKLVFSDKFENDVTFYQLHYILCDLFMYKIEPFVLPKSKSSIENKLRYICSISFIDKGMDMINLLSIFRNKELTSFLPPGLKVKVPLRVLEMNQLYLDIYLIIISFQKVCLIVIILFVHVRI